MSIIAVYNYFLCIPYFNSLISIFWGSLICNYFWISINALLMQFFKVRGHISIICIGMPLIVGMVYSLRKMRIHRIVLMNQEKIKSYREALNQILTIQEIVGNYIIKKDENIMLIGIVNLHILECQNSDCPCKSDTEFFDATTEKFSIRSNFFHKNSIFLKYYNKQLYEAFLNTFVTSCSLHIYFSYFLFRNMKNIHSALLEWNVAEKKKPSFKEQFEIYRQRSIIEKYIRSESAKENDSYTQLTEIIKFEMILDECQKSIEKVANFQIEFWSQVAAQIPDLNILNDLVNKIFESTEEAESYWKKLCQINPSYPKALILYGNYMMEIKNNNKIGSELLEK